MNIDLKKYTDEWFNNVSLEELNSERESINHGLLLTGLSARDKVEYHSLLFKFDYLIRRKN